MSVRAYRIKHIDYAQEPSFNLWHDQKLVEFLADKDDLFAKLNADCCGVAEVSIETLEKAIEQAAELGLDDCTIEALKRDIEAGRADGYVSYYCI